MPYTCRLIDFSADSAYIPEPGDMWFAPGYDLSDEYRRDHADTRQPLWVCLPGRVWFCVDSNATSGGGGWRVTGEPPRITVDPSINCIGVYHGWLRDGVLTDDVDGRPEPGADGGGR